MSEENHMGWKLVSGVRRDVINLFKLFSETNSVRFEEFCKVWKEMSFSHIYSNRVSFVEVLEFTEELLQIVKEYLFSVYEFHTRVAALYALYGLYFKQPIRRAAKIRFTKTEWEEIYSLVEDSKKAEHFDVAFIFIKLYLSGAFSFVATVRPAGLERGFRKYFEKRSAFFSKAYDVELLYRPLVSEKLVNSLVKLEALYCKKKSDLLGGKNLVFIDGKFAETLKEELKNYASSSQGQGNAKNTIQAQVDVESETSTEVKSKSKGEGNVQTGTSAKASKSKKNNKADENKDSDGEVECKKRKFSKKQLELIAKKKAEYYIQKLQLENGPKESYEKNLSILNLEELDFSE